MGRSAISAAAILIAGASTGCATTYKPDGFGGGYSDTQIDENVFRVSVRGNAKTSFDRAEELALMRGADLAYRANYAYFIVAEKSSAEQRGAFTMPQQSYTTGTVNAYGNSANWNSTTTNTGGQTFGFSKPSVTMTIICGNHRPANSGVVYDVARLCKILRSKYGTACGQIN